MTSPGSASPSTDRAMLAGSAMWLVLVVVLIADALDLMDSTLTVIAAPTIAASLGGGESLIKWLGSAYAMALGSLLVIGGRLGDRYGQRQTFLVGIAGFTLASAACGLAPSSAALILARLCQGGFGALLIPQGVAILTLTVPREMFGKVFSFFGPALGLAAIGGPLLGAFILDANIAGLGWRPMFLVNIVLGSIGFVLAWNLLPRTTADRSVVLDVVGSALLGVAMLLLIYGLIEGSSTSWTLINIAIVGGGVAAILAFGIRLKTARHPLLMPSLLRNRGFSAGLVMALAFFSVVSGLGYVISLFLQVGLGLTPVEAAIRGIAPFSIGIIVASFAAAPLIARLGRTLFLAGLIVTLIGVIGLGLVVHAQGVAVGTVTLLVPVFVVGLGMGTGFGTLFDIALGDVATDEAGSASGALSAVQQLSSAVGAALIVSIWFQSVATDIAGAMLTCLVAVGVVLVGCMALVGLLPRKAAEHEGF